MATPRKHWFRVADSVALEDWDNDVAATFLRLLAHLNTRRARDDLGPSEACSVVLSRAMAMQITGSGSTIRAVSILHRLATSVSLTVDRQGTSTVIGWPKCAEFQGWTTREPGNSREISARELPLPGPGPGPGPGQEKEKTPEKIQEGDARGGPGLPVGAQHQPAPPAEFGLSGEAKPAKPARKRRGDAHGPVPEVLEAVSVRRLEVWCRNDRPHQLGRLPELIAACLDHHRKSANRAGVVDWEAAVRNWVRGEIPRATGTGPASKRPKIPEWGGGADVEF